MITINRNNPTPGEITSSLTNSTDAAGLHFDGVAGNIDIPGSGSAPVVALGTKFSFEFIVQAGEWPDTNAYLLDFYGTTPRFVFGRESTTSYNLGIYDDTSWKSFGVKVLDDLKVHHLVLTIDETAAVLYDNGNQVATVTISASHDIDSSTQARLGSQYDGLAGFLNATFYRARFWNKTLSQAEVTASYENATVPFADQYGSQTELSSNTDFSGSWSGGVASGYTNTGGTPTEESTIVYGSNTRSQKVALTSTKLDLRVPNATSVAGQNYRFTAFVRSSVGVTIALHDYNGATTANFGTKAIVADTWTEVSGVVTPTNTTRQFQVKTTGEVTADIYVGQISVVAAGCVADYDLAFAQPEISTMVQDRAGAADGTSSATGVTQVTPIEQLNSKSARIGTSAATPADGEVIAGKLTVGDSSTNELLVGFESSSQDFSVGANGTNFMVCANATDLDANQLLTITSAGLATFSAGIVSSAMPTSDPSVAGQLWNDSGTVKISAG